MTDAVFPLFPLVDGRYVDKAAAREAGRRPRTAPVATIR
jgi:hypothetical protein